MTVMCADLGGTRLKIGVRRPGQDWEITVRRSPRSLPALTAALAGVWQHARPDAWAIGLPGRVAPDGSRWIKAAAHLRCDGLTRDDLGKLCRTAGLPAPALMTNDASAMAEGLLAGRDGTVAQISTGLGARVIQAGRLQPHPSDPELMMLADVRDLPFTAAGRTRSYQDWLGHRPMQAWLPEPLAGLSYRHLAASGHPVVEQLADAAAAWICELAARSPCPKPLILGGGGALALGPLISRRIDVQLAPDAETPGLDGLRIMLQRDPAR